MFINHSSKQVTAKIVYYGPGLSGKTTNLQYIFSVTNPKTRGELVSIETDVERTLFFDLLPINVGLINGYQTRFQLYTVPGQVFYDSTRQLVLKGADGIVFVADSQELMEKANRESLENLRLNLSKHNQKVEDLPVVFQFNKRDLKNTAPIELLNKQLNILEAPYFGAIAVTGTGVIETLREISSLTLKKIKNLLDQSSRLEAMGVFVNFDTNREHEIIKREELPLKKVSVKTPEDFQDKISFAEDKAEPVMVKEKEKQINDSEEVLELTEFEQIEEIEAPPKEKKTGDSQESKALDETQLEIEVEELMGFEDLEEIQLLGEPIEPVETGKVEKVKKVAGVSEDTEITGVKEIEEAAEVKEVKKSEQPLKMDKTVSEMELEKVEALKEAPQKPKPPKPSKSSKSSKPTAVDLLEKLKDHTRLTIIKEIKKLPQQDAAMVIEVKDQEKALPLLEPIEVKIKPGTKKITLILDIKK